jgi:2-iminobutanoate/2-iminopropanoate deaminase
LEIAQHNPVDGIYATTPDYVHAVEVRGADRSLFVAGTMGLDQRGTPGATLTEQLDLACSNIRTILASAGMTVDDIVRLTSYLRDASYAAANAEARAVTMTDGIPKWIPPPWIDPDRTPIRNTMHLAVVS